VAFKSRDSRQHFAKGIFHPIAEPKVRLVVDPYATGKLILCEPLGGRAWC
jgi:hypothetical protein